MTNSNNLCRDLWIYLYDLDDNFCHFVKDMYDESRLLRERDIVSPRVRYSVICFFALSIAKRSGRLPDHLHTQLILGESNPSVEEYVRLFG